MLLEQLLDLVLLEKEKKSLTLEEKKAQQETLQRQGVEAQKTRKQIQEQIAERKKQEDAEFERELGWAIGKRRPFNAHTEETKVKAKKTEAKSQRKRR